MQYLFMLAVLVVIGLLAILFTNQSLTSQQNVSILLSIIIVSALAAIAAVASFGWWGVSISLVLLIPIWYGEKVLLTEADQLAYNTQADIELDFSPKQLTYYQLSNTQQIAVTGLLMALVAVATMLIKFPVPATQGYVHPGDSMIYLAAVVFGPKVGLLAGGVGSALADLLAGYGQWAIPTLLVKGLEGLIIGSIAVKSQKFITATFAGGGWMVVGYYLVGAVLTNSFVVPLAEIHLNIIQAISGLIIAFLVLIALIKTDALRILQE